MESYEEFCSSSLARLRTAGKVQTCSEASKQQGALSLIRFHGMAVLSPVLSEEQRSEMTQYRQRAAQLEAERHSLRRSSKLTRIQDVLDSVQTCKSPKEEGSPAAPPTHCSPALPPHSSPKPESVNGFALLPNVPGPPWCGRGGAAVERDAPVFGGGVSGVSLQSLLRRSREYMEREQGRRGSRGSCRATPVPRESLSDKENESGGAGETQGHSPLSPAHGQPGSDPSVSPDSLSGSHPRCLTGPYSQLPSPEPSLSPRPHRRRPRPVSAGNILISFPVCGVEQGPGGLGRAQEGGALAAQGATATPASSEKRSPEHPSLSPPGVSSRRGSHTGAGEKAGPLGPAVAAALGQDVLAPAFRRRSQTLDSQLYPTRSGPPIDRSQERVPRFIAGLPWRAPCRRSPPDSPAPLLLRAQAAPSPSPTHSPGIIKRSLDTDDAKGSPERRLNLNLLPTPPEQPDSKAGQVQRQVQVLEEMRRQLEEEHALQLSLLIAEQEREQERLRQELEERERRLKDRPAAGDLGVDWKVQRDSYPALSPASGPSLSPARSPASSTLSPAGSTLSPVGSALSHTGSALSPAGPALTPAERSPGHSIHSMGFPSLLSPNISSSAPQTPAYLWGPSWGKPRGRLSQYMTPEQQVALCRLGAITRGFLTRRLLKTEKVKHLRQTVQDTQEFIRSFQTEAPMRRGSLSAQDLSLQGRVRAQLRAALYDVHDIFFEMPLGERLSLLQQDRELRLERKLREMEKAKSPRERVTLSAATQKSLDRKKQRGGETPGQAKRTQQKPKSPPTNRVLQPSQGQNAPVPGQLLRQGSLYRKTPEERLKHSDSLRKQHSLG
ncbi:centriolar coiled-coil protein of 110 kDa-like [Megalops cyprinoides]|uniref:centriolar coiled-coil protein of 110 kDa-like n=1 Tax=Megalops cyprinoides TaxID=118141 RepID=UPI00186445BD|nr:centriolar coiled-coil protein of 110 kDa-like [Megalops cyprinoides]